VTTALENAIRREKLSDELRAIRFQNINQLPNETYEENLGRRARLSLRESEILKEMFGF
jgi:hypothetical protein